MDCPTRYDAVLRRSGEVWVVRVPSLPEIMLESSDLSGLERLAQVAIAEALDVPADAIEVAVRFRSR